MKSPSLLYLPERGFSVVFLRLPLKIPVKLLRIRFASITLYEKPLGQCYMMYIEIDNDKFVQTLICYKIPEN